MVKIIENDTKINYIGQNKIQLTKNFYLRKKETENNHADLSEIHLQIDECNTYMKSKRTTSTNLCTTSQTKFNSIEVTPKRMTSDKSDTDINAINPLDSKKVDFVDNEEKEEIIIKNKLEKSNKDLIEIKLEDISAINVDEKAQNSQFVIKEENLFSLESRNINNSENIIIKYNTKIKSASDKKTLKNEMKSKSINKCKLNEDEIREMLRTSENRFDNIGKPFYWIGNNDQILAVITPEQAMVVLLLNIFIPGIGTLISSCYIIKNDQKYPNVTSQTDVYKNALVHFLMGFILIGWIMGILYARDMIKLAKQEITDRIEAKYQAKYMNKLTLKKTNIKPVKQLTSKEKYKEKVQELEKQKKKKKSKVKSKVYFYEAIPQNQLEKTKAKNNNKNPSDTKENINKIQ